MSTPPHNCAACNGSGVSSFGSWCRWCEGTGKETRTAEAIVLAKPFPGRVVWPVFCASRECLLTPMPLSGYCSAWCKETDLVRRRRDVREATGRIRMEYSRGYIERWGDPRVGLAAEQDRLWAAFVASIEAKDTDR